MHSLVSDGDKVTIRWEGRELEYVVAGLDNPAELGLYVVRWQAVKVTTGQDLKGSEADYPVLLPRTLVIVRTAADLERQAKVVRSTDAGIILGPTRMLKSNEGCDCPYCWRRDVKRGGTGVGSGPGPAGFECPDCGKTWRSLEWNSLARRWP